jgi:hypothetical protein
VSANFWTCSAHSYKPPPPPPFEHGLSLGAGTVVSVDTIMLGNGVAVYTRLVTPLMKLIRSWLCHDAEIFNICFADYCLTSNLLTNAVMK